MTKDIYNIPQIKSVKAMPEYGLTSVDFYPFMSDSNLSDLEVKVFKNLDTKKDIKNLIDGYTHLKNSILIPDGRGNLYRWFFNSQENMIKFLKDKQNAN